MKTIISFGLLILFSISPGVSFSRDTPKPVKSDSDLLQGTWNWDPEAEQSEALPKVDLVSLVFKGKRITFHYKIGDQAFESEHEIEIISKTTPKEFNLKSLDKDKVGKVTTLGLFEVTEQKLKICYRGSDSSRPKNFQDLNDKNNETMFLSLTKSK